MYNKLLPIKIFILLISFPVLGQKATYAHSLVYRFGTRVPTTTEQHILDTSQIWQQNGYGFDFDTADHVQMLKEAILATESVYFSTSLFPANYLVEVQLGAISNASINTVKVESKRLLINQLVLPKGEIKNIRFTVDLRNKQIDTTQEVQLKDRDKISLNWDSKLSIEFSKGTIVRKITITKCESVPTLFLAGDSTVADQDLTPWASWGQFITQYFNESLVVANYAASGASLASFKGRKRWAKILSLLGQGDYVIIEFAHNDEKRKGEGIGPWQSYTELLKEYVTSAREKGGIPILVTPVQRRSFRDDGTLIPTHGAYPDAMREVARSLSVPLIDLTAMTTTLYESWGIEDSKKAFVHYASNTFVGQKEALEDNTHFNDFGANEIALCVVQGIKSLDVGLEKYLRGTKIYSPQHPNNYKDWTLPMSPRFEATKPDGN